MNEHSRFNVEELNKKSFIPKKYKEYPGIEWFTHLPKDIIKTTDSFGEVFIIAPGHAIDDVAIHDKNFVVKKGETLFSSERAPKGDFNYRIIFWGVPEDDIRIHRFHADVTHDRVAYIDPVEK